MAERRELTFKSLDDVVPEAEHLLPAYRKTAEWSLGQVCRHLRTSFDLMSDGKLGVPDGPVPEALRARFFRSDRYPDGLKIPIPVLKPPASLDDRVEVEALAKAIARYESARGPFPHHPLLGPLTREQWDRFHVMHCAHHLGFLAPGVEEDPEGPVMGPS